NRRSFPQERDAKKCTKGGAPSFLVPPIRVFRIGQNVGDMNNFAFEQDAAGYRSSVDSGWVTCGELGVFRRESVACFEVVSFALRSPYGYGVCLAQPCR